MSLLGGLFNAVVGRTWSVGKTWVLPAFNTNKENGNLVDVIPQPDFTKVLDRRNKLLDACLRHFDKAIPRRVEQDGKHSYQPGPYQPILHADNSITTFCNCFLNDVLMELGCNDAWDPAKKAAKMANEIFDFLTKSPDWTELDMQHAQDMANHGYLVVVAQKDPASGHGHVCLVRPGAEQASGRWVSCPVVVNVGKDCFVGKGMSWAFSEMPKFFLWRKGI